MATFSFSPAKYGPTVSELLSTDRLPELGPGQPDMNRRPALQDLRAESLFGDQQFDKIRLAAVATSIDRDDAGTNDVASRELDRLFLAIDAAKQIPVPGEAQFA